MLNLCWYAAAKVLFQYGISGICTQYSQDNFWIILHVSLIIQPVLKDKFRIIIHKLNDRITEFCRVPIKYTDHSQS